MNSPSTRLALLFFLLLSVAGSECRAERGRENEVASHSHPSSAFSSGLRFGKKRDGEFKILQVADMHYANGKDTECLDVPASEMPFCSDLNTTAFIRRVIEAENPDLVVFTVSAQATPSDRSPLYRGQPWDPPPFPRLPSDVSLAPCHMSGCCEQPYLLFQPAATTATTEHNSFPITFAFGIPQNPELSSATGLWSATRNFIRKPSPLLSPSKQPALLSLKARSVRSKLVSSGCCLRCGGSGHMARECRNGIMCFECSKIGHYAFICTVSATRPQPRFPRRRLFQSQPSSSLPAGDSSSSGESQDSPLPKRHPRQHSPQPLNPRQPQPPASHHHRASSSNKPPLPPEIPRSPSPMSQYPISPYFKDNRRSPDTSSLQPPVFAPTLVSSSTLARIGFSPALRALYSLLRLATVAVIEVYEVDAPSHDELVTGLHQLWPHWDWKWQTWQLKPG